MQIRVDQQSKVVFDQAHIQMCQVVHVASTCVHFALLDVLQTTYLMQIRSVLQTHRSIACELEQALCQLVYGHVGRIVELVYAAELEPVVEFDEFVLVEQSDECLIQLVQMLFDRDHVRLVQVFQVLFQQGHVQTWLLKRIKRRVGR